MVAPTLRRSSGSGRPRRALASRRGRIVAMLAALAGLAAPLPFLLQDATAAQPVPRVPARFGAMLEAFARYEPAQTCSPTAKPGTRALASLLTHTYDRTRSLGISRSCGGGRSEHKEGRAFDWGARAWVPGEYAQAEAGVNWLLAPDARGNRAAMARRLGVMYIIWDDKIWSASAAGKGWQPYRHRNCRSLSSCGATYRHRDHVHISLSWDGAMKRTSFWTGGVDDGHVSADLHAVPRLPAYERPLRRGDTGSTVLAVEKALRLPHPDRVYDRGTEAAVNRIRRSLGYRSNGILGPITLSALQRRLDADARAVLGVDHVRLESGSRNAAAVRVLQQALHRPATGVFDGATLAAVRAFQTAHGIRPDGVVGPRTWFALRGV